jgi:hypothetical protein
MSRHFLKKKICDFFRLSAPLVLAGVSVKIFAMYYGSLRDTNGENRIYDVLSGQMFLTILSKIICEQEYMIQ